VDVADEIYKFETTLRDAGTFFDAEVLIRIPIPQGDYGTVLNADHPRYWELRVGRALFLLPIYSAAKAA
jgi:hypothetical protein